MRVITGEARGRRLAAPEGLDTRPTTDMVKEAIFSIVQFEIPGARVLDLCAGSGQMGVEALSRGALSGVFVDASKKACAVIAQNLESCGLADKAKVCVMDAKSYLSFCGEEFDLAFLDPPYETGIAAALLPVLAQRMSEAGVMLCETRRGEEMPQEAGAYRLKKQYRYGKTMVHVYRREAEDV